MLVLLFSPNFHPHPGFLYRFSATNCAKVYDMSLSGRNTKPLLESGWQFGFKLKTEHIWDAFVILTLLRDCERRGRTLNLPHDGNQKDRFTAAMEERNTRIVREGQDELRHRCKKCTRTYEWYEDDGTLRHSELSVCLQSSYFMLIL